MSLIYFDGQRVRELLPMSRCIDTMDETMRGLSDGRFKIPPRTIFAPIDSAGFFGVMPGSSADPPTFGAKIATLYPMNPQHGRPPLQGFVVLFDHATGAPLAFFDAAEITALRTAAASALATRELAPPDAKTLGILGTGVQATSHIEAMCSVRSIREVRVWGRSTEKAREFAARYSGGSGPKVTAVASSRDAAECDIVCTVTGSGEPVLFGEWVRSGTHVNLVGAHTPKTREADTALIARGRVYVDSRESAANEAGDLLIPVGEGAIRADHPVGEIGELLLGRIGGRTGSKDITVFKSLGVVAQDITAAWAVWQQSLATS